MPTVKIADKPTLDKIARAVGVNVDDSTKKNFGVRINLRDRNSDTAVEYIADAVGMTPAKFVETVFDYGDWANAWFVRDNHAYIVDRLTGLPKYQLKDDDYTKCTPYGGQTFATNTSTVFDNTGSGKDFNILSSFPTVWVYIYDENFYRYVYIANYKVNENYHAYAHTREDGSVASKIFIGTTPAKVCTIDSTSYARSAYYFDGNDTSIICPTVFQNYPVNTIKLDDPSAMLTAISNNGDGYYPYALSQHLLIQALLLVMFKSTSPQIGNIKEQLWGTAQKSGQFSGSSSTTTLVNNSKGVKVFHLDHFRSAEQSLINGGPAFQIYGCNADLRGISPNDVYTFPLSIDYYYKLTPPYLSHTSPAQIRDTENSGYTKTSIQTYRSSYGSGSDHNDGETVGDTYWCDFPISYENDKVPMFGLIWNYLRSDCVRYYTQDGTKIGRVFSNKILFNTSQDYHRYSHLSNNGITRLVFIPPKGADI